MTIARRAPVMRALSTTSGAKVITEKSRSVDSSDLARILHDVEQAATQHRQTPRLAPGKEPCSGDLLVALGSQIHPEQMSQLADAQERAIYREERTSIDAHRLLAAPSVSFHSRISRHTTLPVDTSTQASEASGSLRPSK